MASLIKPWITTYHLPDGTRVKRGTPGARKRRQRTKSCYVQLKDPSGVWKRIKLCKDKTSAEQMKNELVKRTELERAGIVDPFEMHRKRPLNEHLADFEASLQNKGDTEDHVKL